MMLNQGATILCLSLSLIFISCIGEDSNKSNGTQTPITVHDDTTEKDIPERFKHGILWSYIENTEKSLELKSLYNGIDSLCIRIDFKCNSDTEHIISILKRKSEWDATFISYRFFFNEYGDIDSGKKQWQMQRVPKSGWQSFSYRLLKTGITELPDYTKLKTEYSLPAMDGDEVIVQIATPTTYRIYSYPQLQSNVRSNNGPAKLEEALMLIEREFNYKRPCE